MSSQTKPVWFITGASSGFGNEMALAALKLGHTVVATARNPSSIKDLADLGADTMAYDVTSPAEDLAATAKAVIDRHGRVDYLINAAGYVVVGAIEELTAKEVFDCFNTNVFGTIATTKAFLPHMRAQPANSETNVRGTVVTFGSLGSWQGGAVYSVYAATKASASILAESLRQELSPFDIRATVVEPGYTRTNFLKPGACIPAANPIDAYQAEDTPSGQVQRALKATNGNQLGDVVKAARVIVEILTGTGVGEGKELPLRIVTGSDAEEVIRTQTSKAVAILDEWKDVIRSTDH